MAVVAPNSVGWYILEGYPWWPVFVCDQTKLRANLHNLGNGHRGILKKARDFPKHYALVYYFGSHEFSLAPLNKGVVLKPWECEDKDAFLKGHPKHLAKRKSVMDDLLFSIQEAEDFLAQPEDIRLPPYFVPSDLDPTLEPPPKVTPEEEEEEEENAEGDPEGDADMEDAEGPEERAEDEDASDGESKKKPKKKKDKKDKPTKKKKDKKSKDKKSEVKEGKKRKKAGDENKDEKPTKAAKVKPESDVKAEKKEKPAEAVPTSEGVGAEEEEKPKQEPLEGDELTAKLEKEIRWILLNCQFEEMTTKTVRKLLERRLGMDLRHHKAQIKEGVARVIESMEDGADGTATANGETDEAAVKPEAATDKEENVKEQDDKKEGVKAEEVKKKEEVTKEEQVEEEKKKNVKEEKEEKDVKEEKEEKGVKEKKKEENVKEDDDVKPKKEEETEPSISERLAEAASRLEAASVTDEQVLEALVSLESIASVDREVLAKSKLHAHLVALQSHSFDAVKDKVAALAKQWNVEAALVPKKEVDEKRLLELKAKLESPETSHDDICACLNELTEMPVKIAHLKKTKIARSVADLRQHVNDRVSSKANSLRRAWMKLASRDNTEALKSLEKMNHVLEQREDDDKTEDAKLEVLEKLLGMSLRTQDIIESKIGVAVSKLRKSSNAKVAKAAAKLRKKWKSEAGAA